MARTAAQLASVCSCCTHAAAATANVPACTKFFMQDVEGTTDPSAPADVLSGGAAALAAAAKTPGRHKTGSSPLTVKGAMPGVKKLDELQIRGVWEQHAKFGWQVR